MKRPGSLVELRGQKTWTGSRRLLLVLVLLLVPVLVVAGPARSASAATVASVGPVSIINFKTSMNSITDKAGAVTACSMPAYLADDGLMLQVRVKNGDCSTGWYTSPNGSLKLEFKGQTSVPPTTACSASINWVDFNLLTSVFGGAGNFNARNCLVTQVCYTLNLKHNGGFNRDYVATGCEDVSLGLPLPPDNAVETAPCPYLTQIVRPTFDGPIWAQFTSSYQLGEVMHMPIHRSAVTSQAGSLGTWGAYAIMTQINYPENDGMSFMTTPDTIGLGVGSYNLFLGPLNDVTPPKTQGWLHVPRSASVTAFAGNTVGDLPVQMYISGQQASPTPPKAAGWTVAGYGFYKTPSASSAWSTFLKTPQDSATGLLGVTDPSKCSFYWGVKVASKLTDTTDEPIGSVLSPPVTTEPDAAPDPGVADEGGKCSGFSWTDPTSWAGAGICAMVDAISGLVEAMAEILAWLEDLLQKLSNLFYSLLVPSPGFFETKLDGVKDAWSETPPGVVVTTAATLPGKFTPPASDGCAGPVLPLDLPILGGGGTSAVDLHLFSTCDEGRAKLAGILRIALSLLVVVSGFLTSLWILGASIGVDTGVGKTGARS